MVMQVYGDAGSRRSELWRPGSGDPSEGQVSSSISSVLPVRVDRREGKNSSVAWTQYHLPYYSKPKGPSLKLRS